MKRQKKRGGLNKNSGNGEKYKFSYCFALLEKWVLSSYFRRVEEEWRKREGKKKRKEKL